MNNNNPYESPNYNNSGSKYAKPRLERSFAMGPQGQVYNNGKSIEISRYGNRRGDKEVLRPTAQNPKYTGGKRRKSARRKSTKRKSARRKSTRRKGTRRR